MYFKTKTGTDFQKYTILVYIVKEKLFGLKEMKSKGIACAGKDICEDIIK